MSCFICGLSQDDPAWITVIVPDEHWLEIAPRENGGGRLCFQCMREAFKRKGMTNVPCRFYYADEEDIMLSELYEGDRDKDDSKINTRWSTQSASHSKKGK